MPLILVLGRLKQEDCKFKDSLGYTERPCLKKLKRQSKAKRKQGREGGRERKDGERNQCHLRDSFSMFLGPLLAPPAVSEVCPNGSYHLLLHLPHISACWWYNHHLTSSYQHHQTIH
jgi:hypothetical protein